MSAPTRDAPRSPGPRRRWITLATVAGLLALGGAVYLWQTRSGGGRPGKPGEGSAADTGQRLDQHRADLLAIERCVAGGEPMDLVMQAVLRTDGDDRACMDLLPPFIAEVRQTAESRGVALPGTFAEIPPFSSRYKIKELAALCGWLAVAHGALDALEGTGQRSPRPACDVGGRPLALVKTSPDFQLQEGSAPRILTGRDARRDIVVLDGERDRMKATRTADGSTWTVRAMPQGFRGSFRELVWNDAILAAIVTGEPHQLYVDEGGTWTKRAALVAKGVDSLQAIDGGLAVVTHADADGRLHDVAHSTDGGRRFSPPLRAIDATGQEAVVWVEPDRSVLVLAAPVAGAPRFEVTRLAPSARTPVKLASLAWAESAEPFARALAVCRDGDTVWALVRHRIVISRDAGRTWRELAALESTRDLRRLTCARAQLALLSQRIDDKTGTTHQVRVCDATSCGPQLAAPVEPTDLVGVRLGDRRELWIAKRGKGLIRAPERFAVAVYRIDAAALAPERIYLPQGGARVLPIVQLEEGYLLLDEP